MTGVGEPLCSVGGCGRSHLARGFCSRQYQQWKRNTTPGERARITIESRFWAKVDRTARCWLWTGTRNPHGYGQCWDGQRVVLAHRYAYELLVGPIPDGLSLDHLCRVPACVNPAHLEPVTHRENMRRGVYGSRTHCKNGHEFTPENTRLQRLAGTDRVKRHCKTCKRIARSEGRWK